MSKKSEKRLWLRPRLQEIDIMKITLGGKAKKLPEAGDFGKQLS